MADGDRPVSFRSPSAPCQRTMADGLAPTLMSAKARALPISRRRSAICSCSAKSCKYLENAPPLCPCSAAWLSSKRDSFQAYCARINNRPACNRVAGGRPEERAKMVSRVGSGIAATSAQKGPLAAASFRITPEDRPAATGYARSGREPRGSFARRVVHCLEAANRPSGG